MLTIPSKDNYFQLLQQTCHYEDYASQQRLLSTLYHRDNSALVNFQKVNKQVNDFLQAEVLNWVGASSNEQTELNTLIQSWDELVKDLQAMNQMLALTKQYNNSISHETLKLTHVIIQSMSFEQITDKKNELYTRLNQELAGLNINLQGLINPQSTEAKLQEQINRQAEAEAKKQQALEEARKLQQQVEQQRIEKAQQAERQRIEAERQKAEEQRKKIAEQQKQIEEQQRLADQRAKEAEQRAIQVEEDRIRLEAELQRKKEEAKQRAVKIAENNQLMMEQSRLVPVTPVQPSSAQSSSKRKPRIDLGIQQGTNKNLYCRKCDKDYPSNYKQCMKCGSALETIYV